MANTIPDEGRDEAAAPDLGAVADALHRESERLRRLAEELYEFTPMVRVVGKGIE